jgi:hypothetical protein
MVDARLALLITVAKKKKEEKKRGGGRGVHHVVRRRPNLKMIYCNMLNAKYDVIRDGFHMMLLCSGETSITKVRLEGAGCVGSS